MILDKEIIEKKYSKELQWIIDSIKDDLINEMPVKQISTGMFVMFCLDNDSTMLFKAINMLLNSITISEMHDKLYALISEDVYTALRPNRNIDLSEELYMYLDGADKIREKMGRPYITSDQVLLAIMIDKQETKTRSILLEFGLSYDILFKQSEKAFVPPYFTVEEQENLPGKQNKEENGQQTQITLKKRPIFTFKDNNGKKKNSIQFCRNLNNLAYNGKIDKLVGREKEILEIEKIFARRKCNNVFLVGKDGVGKTAIVEGLALMITESKAPLSLLSKTIYSLKINEILSGAGIHGIFEERIAKVFQTLKKMENTILFIDDIHTIVNDGKTDNFDLISNITEYVENSDIQIIIATTPNGYRKVINTNQSLKTSFQKITVEPTNKEETLEILTALKLVYENYHNVLYPPEILKECVSLSDRYITDIPMPSSALGIIDEVGSLKRIELISKCGIRDKIEHLSNLHSIKDGLVKNDKIDESNVIEEEITNVRSEITDDINALSFSDEEITITKDDLYNAISQHTEIPISRITVSEKEILSNIKGTLNKYIIGQEEALETVANAIKRNKVGLYRKNKPLYSVFFCGSTGTGKSLTAKTLATEIFGDEKYLVKFDMSEYSDKTAVNKFIGAGAGYIGYENGGLLTEAIKNKKHAVLLFDEIEKADIEIYNLLLQVMDEATLTDNMGNKVDFKNCIIIFTSNVGAKKAANTKQIGFVKDESENKKDIILNEIKNVFPPEFINRLDDIVYFNNLTDENIDKIIELEINKLKNRLEEIGHEMSYDKNLLDFVFNKTLDEREYGARPISRIIEKEIENKITDLILEKEYDLHSFTITADQDNIIVEDKEKTAGV